MAVKFIPSDAAERKRIEVALDETLFVEAGAGTGKTTSLVDRVARLVSTGTTTLDRIAAITFTEAAASELRDRVRERLEESAADRKLSDLERELCAQGVQDLDHASIQTLHSFSGSILRERPIEAGLPPLFETMDAIASDIAFDEAWSGWLESTLDGDGDHSELEEALSLGFSLGLTVENLKDITLRFYRNYDLLEGVVFKDDSLPTVAAVGAITEAAEELERLCAYSDLGAGDMLFNHVQGKLGSIRRLSEMDPRSASAYGMLGRILPLKYGRGRQSDWQTDPHTGVNACKLLKDTLSDLDADTNAEIGQARRSALMPALRSLSQFVIEYSRENKRRGRAGYHDLLVWARDLLRDNLEARDHFRNRYSHLLIDEAQDTDPIQAEIAMFIAEEASEDIPAEQRPMIWDEVTPERGKLFVVGDPKQSIYRFRRADVRQMEALRTRMAGDTLRLVQNFRSQGPVIDWVNHLFGQWMALGEEQAEYAPIANRWEANTSHKAAPRVWSLGGPVDGNMDVVHTTEAGAISSLLKGIVESEWQVLDPRASEDTGTEEYRDATYSDICILMPTRTGLRYLEQALEDAGIPFRLEGSSLVFATQEVRDLLNCLKAIDDPSDQVAMVAALRSPAFACSDADLLKFHDAGGRFDYLSERRMPDGVVAEALTELSAYHERRMTSSPAALTDGFIRERLLMEAALEHPRTREQWRRYRFIVEQARAFAESGGSSLRSFLEWIQVQAKEGARVNEVPVPEGDEEAVRIMTIHGAKGLEFPVVVLTGINSARIARTESVLFDRHGEEIQVSVGRQGRRFETRGYEELKETESRLDEEESIRLFYVATTRARDHLVLSMYRTDNRRGENSAAGRISALMGEPDGTMWEPVPHYGAASEIPAGQQESDQEVMTYSLDRREQWMRERERLIGERGRPVSVAATTLSSVNKPEPEADEPWKRGRGGSSVGRAVHSVLQSIDLRTGSDIESVSNAQAAAEDIPDRAEEIAGLVRTAVESGIVRRAVSSKRFWREIPVAVPVGDGALEGFIDLLFEEDDGLVVVDYKTDSIDADRTQEAMLRYELQAGSYGLAVQKATGMKVKEIVFLFLRPRSEAVVANVHQLAERAVMEAEKYLQVTSHSRL